MNNVNILHLKKELSKIDSLFKKKEFDTVIKKSKILLKKNPNQPIIYKYIAYVIWIFEKQTWAEGCQFH